MTIQHEIRQPANVGKMLLVKINMIIHTQIIKYHHHQQINVFLTKFMWVIRRLEIQHNLTRLKIIVYGNCSLLLKTLGMPELTTL